MTNQPKKATTRRKPAVLENKNLPVYFHSLELENVLCFKDRHELRLSDSEGYPLQWTVILGNNGVGKTTLLRCLAGLEMRRDQFDPTDRYPIFFHSYSPYNFPDFSMTQELEAMQNAGSVISAIFISGQKLSNIKIPEYTKKCKYHHIEIIVGHHFSGCDNELEGLTCYGYGASRRMAVGEISLFNSFLSNTSESLFSDYVSLVNAEEWLLQSDYTAKSSSGKAQEKFKKRFNQIIEVLKKVLPDITDIQIAQADEDYPRPRAKFLTPYGWVHLSSLGLGYRTTISWMVDLVVRLFDRYPDSEDPLAEPAIVLVDEIDLHMHPQWQRTIMEFLTERFPNTQFIVTAHSPLVVQAAQDANIVLLRREGDRVIIDNNPEIIDNWRVDQVLTSVFEIPSARPPQIEKLLAERQTILSKAKLSKADKAKLKELEEKIGALPTAETPDDIKAMDIIRRAAKLLEKPVMEAVE
ncbi:AAA family ATPase [Pseudanabaena biceps]|nr:AAA family ATPase [Pseudanabaena biceps]